jgi:hypothetical protein
MCVSVPVPVPVSVCLCVSVYQGARDPKPAF